MTHQHRHQHSHTHQHTRQHPHIAHQQYTTHNAQTHNTEHARWHRQFCYIQITAWTLGYLRLFEIFTLTFCALHRHKHVPDSSNHSLYLITLFTSSSPEGHCGGNTSHRMVRFVFRHQDPIVTNDLHDLPQCFHVFCYILINILFMFFVTSLTYVYIYICYRESSKTPQHSKWNCVGANRPQHRHMYGHMVCD